MRSRQELIVRVDMIAGTAHATPLINGIKERPFKPNLRMKHLTQAEKLY